MATKDAFSEKRWDHINEAKIYALQMMKSNQKDVGPLYHDLCVVAALAARRARLMDQIYSDLYEMGMNPIESDTIVNELDNMTRFTYP